MADAFELFSRSNSSDCIRFAINMKTIIILSLLSLVAAHIDYYDLVPLDMTALVKKPDDLQKFYNCLMDKGHCNDVYEGYRVVAVDAVKTACKRCTVDQKRLGYVFLLVLRKWLPKQYHEFRHKYDPGNKYFDDLEEELYKYKLLPCL